MKFLEELTKLIPKVMEGKRKEKLTPGSKIGRVDRQTVQWNRVWPDGNPYLLGNIIFDTPNIIFIVE